MSIPIQMAGGLEVLQMVLELDIGWYASGDATRPLMEVDCEIPE